MILSNDSTTISGLIINNSLTWVKNCNILGSRTVMEGIVEKSLLDNQPNWNPYASTSYYNVPYDSQLEDSPAKQFYTWLMAQPEYEGGTQYPPA